MPDTSQVAEGNRKRFRAERIGAALYVPERTLLICGNENIRLEPRLARLLDMFLASGGRVLTRSEILDTVWPDNGSDEALTQAVSRLRRYLGKHAIETRPREGYLFAERPVATELVLADEPPRQRFSGLPARVRPALIFTAGMAAGIAVSILLAPVIFSREILIEEMVSEPGEDPRLVRTRAECSLLVSDCLLDADS